MRILVAIATTPILALTGCIPSASPIRRASAPAVVAPPPSATPPPRPPPPETPPETQPARIVKPETETIVIPGTAHTLEFVRVPGRDGAGDLWVSRTEITWDVFDVFVYGLDRDAAPAGADAVTRPSKPYIAMDRGFGHAGYPALSMSCHSAQEFCRWLGAKTRRTFRLPTETEWRMLCSRAGIADAPEKFAWYAANANRRTHPVGQRARDALGLHDLAGNAAEWCLDEAGAPVVLGGSYLDKADAIGVRRRRTPTPAWNASDPQFPKSIWWLADAGFIGMRVIVEPES